MNKKNKSDCDALHKKYMSTPLDATFLFMILQVVFYCDIIRKTEKNYTFWE